MPRSPWLPSRLRGRKQEQDASSLQQCERQCDAIVESEERGLAVEVVFWRKMMVATGCSRCPGGGLECAWRSRPAATGDRAVKRAGGERKGKVAQAAAQGHWNLWAVSQSSKPPYLLPAHGSWAACSVPLTFPSGFLLLALWYSVCFKFKDVLLKEDGP